MSQERLTPDESVIMVRKLLGMEKNLAILRSQNQMLVNAITAAGYEIHMDEKSRKLYLKALPLPEEKPKKKAKKDGK